MDNLLKEEIELQAQIKLLEGLPYINAWAGNFGPGGYAQMKTCVEFTHIVKLLNEKREKLKNLKELDNKEEIQEVEK